MKRNIYFFLLASVITIIVACNVNKSSDVKSDSTTITKEIITDSVTTTAEEPKADSVYAYLKNVVERNDSVFVDADYIQFLTGDAALATAKKNHEADTSYDDNGKITSIDVPNDYYILNENKKIRQIAIAKDAVFKFMDNQYREHPIKDNSLNSLKIVYNEEPYILTLKNNTIVKLEEVYLP